MVDEVRWVVETMKKREFHDFEMELTRKEKVDIARNFRIVAALYDEAVSLGVLPMKDPLDGIEVDLKIARVVNCVPRTA